MKNIVLYLLFIMSIVALFGFAFSMAQEKFPAGQKIISDSNYSLCSTIETGRLTSDKKAVTDFSRTGDNYKTDFIINYLNKEVKINDKLHKTAIKESAEDLNTLAGWSTSLKSSK